MPPAPKPPLQDGALAARFGCSQPVVESPVRDVARTGSPDCHIWVVAPASDPLTPAECGRGKGLEAWNVHQYSDGLLLTSYEGFA